MEREKCVVIAEIMTPDMANFTGNVHGGYLLSMLDKAAYACATRYCRHNVVTFSVDQVFFKEPIHVGELVSCLATVNYVGKTSMEIGIKVIAENTKTGIKRNTNTCYFTMVAIDDTFKPCAVPPLTPHSEKEKRRFMEAELRRTRRINAMSAHKERKEKEHKENH